MSLLLTSSPQKNNTDFNQSQTSNISDTEFVSMVTNFTDPSLNLSAFIDPHSVTSLAF